MKYWPAIVFAAVALAVAVPVVHELVPDFRLFEHAAGTSQGGEAADSARQVEPFEALGIIEVDRMFLSDTKTTAPAGVGKVAHLTIDARMQRAADTSLRSRRIPAGAIVAMDVRSGDILAYASRRDSSAREDPITSAILPVTDVFKLITAAALVNVSGATSATALCHCDPGRLLALDDLREDKAKDRWCPSMGESIGRNLDAPIARWAYRNLDKDVLEQTANAFGFGADLPFDLPIGVSSVSIPATDMGLVETAIGSGNATMSVMHGLLMAAVVADSGRMVRPVLVQWVEAPGGKVIYRAPQGPRYVRQVISSEVARELAVSLLETTEIGEAFRAFHDDTGHPVLGDVKAAGVTGSERVGVDADQITWFVGFAPFDEPEVVVASVARNRRGASGSAPYLAVDVFGAYVRLVKRGPSAS